MGQQYDEINISAKDYTIFIDIEKKHADEFNLMFARELEFDKMIETTINPSPRG